VLSLNVTDKGLLSGFTKRNYILPMTDTEKDYADVIERLGVAENKLNEMIEDTPKTYAAIADVGTVDDLYNENSTVSEKFAALTHGIGNLELSSRNVNPEGETVMPVADQISYVATVANKAEATALSYGLSIKYLEGQVEDLKKEIESLKAQLNPTE
jgi:prefoldin subunit 5